MNPIKPAVPSPSASPLRISIALCTFNGARFLQQQLDGVTAQQTLPHELVLCDDGSQDQTLAIAQAFAATAQFPVHIVRNPRNLGYSHNFAQAIGLCTGDVVALSDQDDLWYPQKLARLATLFTANPQADGVFSDGDLIDSASNQLAGSLWQSFNFTLRDQQRVRTGQALAVLIQRNVVTGMAFAFRTHWRERLRSMPPGWPHDAWLALMLAQQNKLLACPERLVAYRVHDAQSIGVPITRSEKRQYLRAHGLGGYLALSRKRNLHFYEQAVAQFEDLLAAYAASPNPEDQDAKDQLLLEQARAKAEHSRNAAALLQVSRLSRWPGVLRSRRNHQRYSPTGIKAMIRDLFL